MNDLDEERARLLGVMKTRSSFMSFVFPVIRKKWKQPHEMSFEEAIAFMKGPLRKNTDYCSVGRKTLLLDENMEIVK